MKQRLFTLFATLLCCISMYADGDPEESQLEVYTEFVEETGTLTYYYDDKRQECAGVTEVYDPIGNPNAVRFTGYYEKVNIAVIDPSMKNAPLTSYKNLFYGNYNLETHVNQSLSKMQILKGLENLNTAIVVDMGSMFRGCSLLISLDLSSFNTENVTDMSDMFYYCTALTSLNLSSFNTENVTDMNSMFYHCKALTSLDLSSFNTENVTNMGGMFQGCTALTSLDLRSFKTENVTDMSGMFYRCEALTSLDLSSFNTANVTDMNCMFAFCFALISLDLSSFNPSSQTIIFNMFKDCGKLKTIYCNYDWSTFTNSDYMFNGCISLVGGKGTRFDEGISNKTYARPDGGTESPGYFTLRIKGDADGNGQVNAADIVAISNYMMGNPPTGFNKAAADINFDGVINIADIVAVANILLSGK